MKTILALFVVALLALVATEVSASRLLKRDPAYKSFQEFKKTHNKAYASMAQETHRFNMFKQTLGRIAELNKAEPLAKFGINKFADLHPAEFKAKYLKFRPSYDEDVIEKASKVATPDSAYAVPSTFDWRQPGDGRPVAVTAVKDQGQCGSCWAFSVTECTESAYILAGNSPVNMAPEQIVDCDTQDSGCNGGDPSLAYEYLEKYGLETETAYPYTAGGGQSGTCAYNAADVVTKIDSYIWAIPNCASAANCNNQNETLLQQQVYTYGPPSICVDASSWQTYTSGILSASSGCSSSFSSIDHCVQLTGWGGSGSQMYWSVRNSWAADWGENGYIRLLFGQNTCGVASYASLVELTNTPALN